MLDKYTKLFHELQAYIFEADLTKREIKALLYVNALTTGYRQERAPVQAVAMGKALDMDASDARKTLASLVGKGALIYDQGCYAIAVLVKVNHPDAGKVNHPAETGRITPIGRVNYPEKEGNLPRYPTSKPAPEVLAAAPLKTLDNLLDNNLDKSCAAEQHAPQDPTQKKRTSHDYPAWFEALNQRAPWSDKWPAYKAALKYRPDEAMIAAFNAGLDRWLTSQRWIDGFICNGKTFFNERRWEQLPPQVKGIPQAAPAPKTARDYSW